jgi:hypothetical protein
LWGHDFSLNCSLVIAKTNNEALEPSLKERGALKAGLSVEFGTEWRRRLKQGKGIAAMANRRLKMINPNDLR